MSEHSGLHIHHDSGAPQGSTDYTTLILLHGFAWHGAIFSKLPPLSERYNVRVVLVNRRDYPGAAPYPKKERALLDAAAAEVESEPAAARAKILSYMEYNARDLYDFLVDFVASNDIPKAGVKGPNSGGIVVGGWSFAGGWMLALLAYAHSFPVGEVDPGTYVRRVILYDAPFHVCGYPPLNGDISGSPLYDPSLTQEEKIRLGPDYASGYFKHPNFVDALERRTRRTSPPPSLSTMTAEEGASVLYAPPVDVDGSDCILNLACPPSGAWAVLREKALHVHDSESDAAPSRSWDAVELTYLWGDSTVWEIVWGVHCMKQTVQEAKTAGDKIRRVTFVRIKDANHFMHWDKPEDTVRACLAATSELEEVVIGSY